MICYPFAYIHARLFIVEFNTLINPQGRGDKDRCGGRETRGQERRNRDDVWFERWVLTCADGY